MIAMRAFGCAGLLWCGCVEPSRSSEHAHDAGGRDARAAFACDERASAEPEALRRLTRAQYANTVRDLARWALGDPLEADVITTLAGVDALRSTRDGRLDQALDQTYVDDTLRVADALGRALSAPERLARVAGPCAVDEDAANDDACLASFIHRFGARALRRPLDAGDEAFYRVVYGGELAADPAAYGDVIAVMLSAPELMYFVEHGATELPDRPGRHALSAHELAARLSYHFWQTLPDDALWRAAEDGSLLDPSVLEREVDRLLADPRARATMAELFGEWLGLEELSEVDEPLDMLGYFTWTAPAGFDALFTSELSFARSAELASVYGVEPWDGRSPLPSLPAGERPGLLTRAWFLANDGPSTRPIQRGVRVRRKLLCDELAPPPANANATIPESTAHKTTRQVVEELTEQPGTSCASCHAGSINPIGFAFEGFDALARRRTEQPLFLVDGSPAGALPVDTRTVPRVTPDDERGSSGPSDLIAMMLESGKLEACFARTYFRFTFGRLEDLARDGCALERLRARLVESGRIRDMLREAALLPELQQRRLGP